MFADATLGDLPLMSGAVWTWFTDTAEHWGFAVEELVDLLDMVEVMEQAAPQSDDVVVVLLEV